MAGIRFGVSPAKEFPTDGDAEAMTGWPRGDQVIDLPTA